MPASIAEKKYFGTDGIRGLVGKGNITPAFVMQLGWAAGRVLAREGNHPVLVGKDTRISGYMFESALEAGLSAAGVDVRLLGPMPTPGIAYLAKSTRAQAGVSISASHNPYHDNGVKFFSAQGTKLSDAVESEIERMIDVPMQISESKSLGKARRLVDAPRRYIEFCKRSLSDGAPREKTDISGLRLVVDCANGATYHIAPKVFEELGAEVIVMGVEPDGLNINAGVGACYPEALCAKVRQMRAEAGISLDGDGDRLIMSDEKGNVLDGDDILYILTRMGKEQLGGGVVGTVMSNSGLAQAIEGMGLRFLRTAVGDRHVLAKLEESGLALGGEPSGHIINLNFSTTGDGIVAALQVLSAMVSMDKPLSDLRKGLEKTPQCLHSIELPRNASMPSAADMEKLSVEMERELGAGSRVLVRASGTESAIRIMVECDDERKMEQTIESYAERLRNLQ